MCSGDLPDICTRELQGECKHVKKITSMHDTNLT